MYAINGAEICFNPSATVGALRLEWINIFNHYPALDEQGFCAISLQKALMLRVFEEFWWTICMLFWITTLFPWSKGQTLPVPWIREFNVSSLTGILKRNMIRRWWGVHYTISSEPMWPIEARCAAIANNYYTVAINRIGTVSGTLCFYKTSWNSVGRLWEIEKRCYMFSVGLYPLFLSLN